ncbi:unnamed protein product [Rhizophagus irregularis]|nr:unnamed protein product [Rhizophagus irregularis]CAB4412426.1 unnamed protein product [Rhizophagus irregularis]
MFKPCRNITANSALHRCNTGVILIFEFLNKQNLVYHSLPDIICIETTINDIRKIRLTNSLYLSNTCHLINRYFSNLDIMIYNLKNEFEM